MNAKIALGAIAALFVPFAPAQTSEVHEREISVSVLPRHLDCDGSF